MIIVVPLNPGHSVILQFYDSHSDLLLTFYLTCSGGLFLLKFIYCNFDNRIRNLQDSKKYRYLDIFNRKASCFNFLKTSYFIHIANFSLTTASCHMDLIRTKNKK